MRDLKSKRVVAAASALALAVGAGAAVAASKGAGSSQDSFLSRVAGHLGISTQKLEDATKAAAIDQVDEDLKAGRITTAQADELKARINKGELPFLHGFGPRAFGPRGFGPPMRFHADGPGHGRGISAAADYLNLSIPQVLQKLASGKSLAQIAKDQHKSVDGLKDAMIADAKTHLDQAVKDGYLTQAQADDMLNELKSHIDEIVNGNFFRGHREFHWRSGPPDASAWRLPAA
jgi:hypothetical protein